MAYDSKKTLNKVMLIGCIGQDLEPRKTPSGASVLNFSIATTTSFKSQGGEQQDLTEWHKIVVWRQPADFLAQYAKKGTRVYVEGKLQTRSWDDKDGNKRYTTEIVADQIQILDSGQKAEQREEVPEESEYSEPSGDDLPF